MFFRHEISPVIGIRKNLKCENVSNKKMKILLFNTCQLWLVKGKFETNSFLIHITYDDLKII